MPYSTWESLGSLVVQLIVAPETVRADAMTAEITGGVTSGATEYVTRREGRRVGSRFSMLAKAR